MRASACGHVCTRAGRRAGGRACKRTGPFLLSTRHSSSLAGASTANQATPPAPKDPKNAPPATPSSPQAPTRTHLLKLGVQVASCLECAHGGVNLCHLPRWCPFTSAGLRTRHYLHDLNVAMLGLLSTSALWTSRLPPQGTSRRQLQKVPAAAELAPQPALALQQLLRILGLCGLELQILRSARELKLWCAGNQRATTLGGEVKL